LAIGKLRDLYYELLEHPSYSPDLAPSDLNEIADELARGGSAQRFVGPEPVLRVSRQNIRRKMKRWIEKKHLALCCGPCSKQRQARELVSGPGLAVGALLLSFNRTQTWVVTALLTGHNTFGGIFTYHGAM